MKDKSRDNPNGDENIARKLSQVANKTSIDAQFASELEEKLRNTPRPKTSGWTAFLRQVSPTLRWAALGIFLGLVLNWTIRSLVSTPQPGIDNLTGRATLPPTALPTKAPINILAEPSVIPVTQEGGYDFRSAKLYLAGPLPELPTGANVYLLQPDRHATVEEARALAAQFGIAGEVYQAPGELPDTTDYMMTDGKQRLYVRSQNYFTYYADYNPSIFLRGGKSIDLKMATAAIESFLRAHGFDDHYDIENAPQIPGSFYAVPHLPDGYTLRFDHNLPARLEFVVSDNGDILSVRAGEIDYEQIGTYGIRSAQEAFQQVLASAESIQNGVLESVRSGGILNESYWERSYSDDQTVTLYGRIDTFEPVDSGKPAFLSMNGYTLTGQTPSASPDQLIEARGQFRTEGGIRTFNIESWKASDAIETSWQGTLQREGDQIVLLSDMGEKYALTDVPADVPLDIEVPNEQLMVTGVLVDGNLIWNSIQYFPAGSNYGGGGGGGTGFYKLNLSGTPVPFPTPTLPPEVTLGTVEYVVRENDTLASIALKFGITVEELMQANGIVDNVVFTGQTLFIPGQQEDNPYVGRRFEGQRGTLVINIYTRADGSSRDEFVFVTKNEDGSFLYALLEDVSFEALLPYHHRPLDIWGTVDYVDKSGMPVVGVEKYEAPYPGLTFQLIQGTQKSAEIEGITTTIFTTGEGKSYVQMTPDGSPESAIIGNPGDQVYAEVLFIPDESFGGYPAMRVFNIGLAINPESGEPATIAITADQPYVSEEMDPPENYTPPSLTIEKVELVYYIPDPRYALPDPNATPEYIQPAWRFYGHYSNGDEIEFLVQALRQEYLLPELAPYTPPG